METNLKPLMERFRKKLDIRGFFSKNGLFYQYFRKIFKSKIMSNKIQKKSRILIIDDNPVNCFQISGLVNRETDLESCGSAEDRRQAMQAIEDLKPDLVILDIELKNDEGLDIFKRISVKHPNLPVIIVSADGFSLNAEYLIKLGAKGYINKEFISDIITKAIRNVLHGKTFVLKKNSNDIKNKFIISIQERAFSAAR